MKLLRLLMTALVLAASPGLSPARAMAAAPAECSICGHACCCPDACARIRSDRHVWACANGMANCRMGARNDSSEFSDAKADRVRPTLSTMARTPLAPPLVASMRSVDDLVLAFPSTQDVPTPPPRA